MWYNVVAIDPQIGNPTPTLRRLPDVGADRETSPSAFVAVSSFLVADRIRAAYQRFVYESACAAARWDNECCGAAGASAGATVPVLSLLGHAVYSGVSPPHQAAVCLQPESLAWCGEEAVAEVYTAFH